MQRARAIALLATSLGFLAALPAWGQERSGRGQTPERPSAGSSGSANFFKASKAIGYSVKNQKGEDLGKIEDLAISPDGRVLYAVLSYGGFLGVGDKLFAIPWSALKARPGQDVFYLDVDKQDLEKSPGFHKDNWPASADPRWEKAGGAATASTGAFAGAVQAESAKLAFKLEKGKTYAYDVFPASASREAGARTETDRTDRQSTEGERDRSQKNENEQSAAGSVKPFQYRVLVQDFSQSGESTLQVMYVPEGGQSQEHSVVVRAGADGRIMEVKEGAPSKTNPSAGRSPTESASAFPPEFHSHLGFIVGSGLHQQTLEPGKFYEMAQFMPAGSEGRPGYQRRTPAPLRSSFRLLAPADEESTPGGEGAAACDLGSLRLRFEGKAKEGGHDLALFSVYKSGDLSPRTERRETEQGTRSRESGGGSSAAGGSQAAGSDTESLGQVSFRIDDGLLERCTMSKHPATERSAETSPEFRIQRRD